VSTSKRRDRTVVFRVTEQEYNNLKSACDQAGGRSISDYTRSELLAGTRAGCSDAVLLQRFSEIDHKLSEVHQLTKLMLECMRAGGHEPSS
jgi:hypothetical protein